MVIGSFLRGLFVLGALVVLAGCSSQIGPPEIQGHPAMVNDGGSPRLWLLTKREEERHVSASSSRRSSSTRVDTYYHFDLQAMDPVAARPLWNKRLLTLGDPDAHGYGPSRVIGSAAGARFIGQEGERVWLFVDEYLIALNAADGEVLATIESIEQANPELKGLLPGDAKHYGFDQGLVFMSADARHFVLRGAGLKAEPYVPPAAPSRMYIDPRHFQPRGSDDDAEAAESKLAAKPRCPEEKAPLMLSIGEVPARLVRAEDGLLGLYSEKEAADAADDRWGQHLCWPDSITLEGELARRMLWRLSVTEEVDPYGDSFLRISEAAPVEGGPVFLRGRFLKDLGTQVPRQLEQPAGLAVWHVTRIDEPGRLAMTRLAADLSTLWTTELPLSDNSMMNPVMVWALDGNRLAILGDEISTVDGVRNNEPHLVALDLADGRWQGWNIGAEAALP